MHQFLAVIQGSMLRHIARIRLFREMEESAWGSFKKFLDNVGSNKTEGAKASLGVYLSKIFHSVTVVRGYAIDMEGRTVTDEVQIGSLKVKRLPRMGKNKAAKKVHNDE